MRVRDYGRFGSCIVFSLQQNFILFLCFYLCNSESDVLDLQCEITGLYYNILDMNIYGRQTGESDVLFVIYILDKIKKMHLDEHYK